MSARLNMVPKPFDITDIDWLALYWADDPAMHSNYTTGDNFDEWFDMGSGGYDCGITTPTSDGTWEESNFGPNSRASYTRNRNADGTGISSTNLWTCQVANAYFSAVVLLEYEGADTGSLDQHYPWQLAAGDMPTNVRLGYRDGVASDYTEGGAIGLFRNESTTTSTTNNNPDLNMPGPTWWRTRIDWTDGAGELLYYNAVYPSGSSRYTWTHTWADSADTWTPDGMAIGTLSHNASTSGWHGKIAFVGFYAGDIADDPKWEALKTWSSVYYGITLY